MRRMAAPGPPRAARAARPRRVHSDRRSDRSGSREIDIKLIKLGLMRRNLEG